MNDLILPLMSDTSTDLGIVRHPKVGWTIWHVVDNFGKATELLAGGR